MRKAVLLSVQPKWCEKMCNKIGENTDGSPIYEKRVEVRKSRPKLDTPFPVYIYQTKKTWVYNIFSKIADWQGKIIGEFVCCRIEEIKQNEVFNANVLCSTTCLTIKEFLDYIGNKTAYCWHISNLVIYDKPKELSEFKKINQPCWYGEMGISKRDCPECQNKDCFIQRPPQSWCYVEELSK